MRSFTNIKNVSLVLVSIIFLALLVASPASAGKKKGECAFKQAAIPSAITTQAKNWTFAPSLTATKKMPQPLVRDMLRVGWQAFGYSKSEANRNAAANMRQIKLDSGFIPNKIRPLPNVSITNAYRGLFSINNFGMQQYKAPGHTQITNPLDNILATVNMQVTAKELWGANRDGILDGTQEGWFIRFGGNPCN